MSTYSQTRPRSDNVAGDVPAREALDLFLQESPSPSTGVVKNTEDHVTGPDGLAEGRTPGEKPLRAVSTALPPSTPAAGAPAETDTVSLGEVLARHVTVFWPEAVAIIEELCAVLSFGGRSEPPIPDPDDVLITSAGAVTLRALGREREISRLGRLLHNLLETSTSPAPLRLFVSQAISSDSYDSVEAFAAALAYYERPQRKELIQAVHRRCRETSALQAREAPAAPLPPGPRAPILPNKAASAVVFVCAAAAMSGVWFWTGATQKGTPVEAPLTPQLVEQSSGPVNSQGQADARGADEPRNNSPFGLRGAIAQLWAVVSGSRTPEAPPASSQATARSDVRRDRRPARFQEAPILVTANPSVVDEARSGGVVSVLSTTPDAAADPGESSTLPAAESLGNESEGSVGDAYSSGSLDVEPPVMLYPQLPPLSAEASRLSSTNTMELLIGEDGRVEQVKLTSVPRRMPDMMLLSSAKTWRFQPAMRKGRAVKYRLAMNWTVVPH